jgi:hypothetical protein
VVGIVIAGGLKIVVRMCVKAGQGNKNKSDLSRIILHIFPSSCEKVGIA